MTARHGVNQQGIVLAAAEMADEIGFEQVTLGLIANKLNIKTPSLYNHIDGMPGLRKELACYGIRKLNEMLSDAAIGQSGEDALFSIGVAYVAFVRKHPGLYEATMGAPDPLDPEVQSASEDVLRLLLRILEAFQLGREEALHTVRGMRSIVHGFASLEAKGGFGLPLDMDESLRRLLKTYLAGLQLKPRARDQ